MQTVTLEQLIALNREISALSAAGVPLSEGLVRVANDFSGPTSELSRRLAERIESGESLGAALDAEGKALPKSYHALVQAGLQSGRLTSALEGYTQTATRMAELRRVLGLATLYPLFLLVTIWVLFLFLSNVVLPGFDWLEIDDQFWVQPLRFSFFRADGNVRWMLWMLVPLVLVAITYFWWRRSATAAEASTTGLQSWLGWIPGVAQVRRLSCEANFADLLRLFVQQQMPLSTAIPLAAEGSGLRFTSAEIRDFVIHLETGQPLGTKSPVFQRLPALIRLALLTNRGPEALASGLQRAADSYHERARNCSQGIAFYLPMTVTALIGGTAVGAYAILLLQPYIATLHEIVRWH